ncbi:MAG: hypothetical protein JWQ35_2550 [Bacteriovoracaceae bacterium]|nr:hypothetical protein [Bacteriovoracaceae bacterium]
MITSQQKAIHERALVLSQNFRKLESDLLSILQEVDREKVYLAFGFASLFEYAQKALLLSDSNSYLLMSVARKAVQIPELKKEILLGNLSLSKAARIVSVITTENKEEWIRKASHLSKRELEREVVKEKPEDIRESTRQVSEDRLCLKLGISDAFLSKLKRVQTILSSSQRKPASMEEAIEYSLDLYLEKKDPVVKADRAEKKVLCPSKVKTGGMVHVMKREPLKAGLKHQVFRRDRGQCGYTIQGRKCSSSSFVEIHHKIPVSLGGQNLIENLITLCSAHHRFYHTQAPHRSFLAPQIKTGNRC